MARLFYYLAPPSQLPKIVSPLLRLLHISPEIERVVLSYLILISRSAPVSIWSKLSKLGTGKLASDSFTSTS